MVIVMEIQMAFKVGDKVRIKQGKKNVGHTLWVITELLPACGCMIKEVSDAVDYAPQRFDLSLLVKA
jgi:hypothetical protein